jgi:hypothetical protein
MLTTFLKNWEKIACQCFRKGSDSQPGCRGTLGCRQEVSGVPPSFEFLPSFDGLLHKLAPIVIFNQLGVPPIFLKDLKGAANQKRLKNTDLRYISSILLGASNLYRPDWFTRALWFTILFKLFEFEHYTPLRFFPFLFIQNIPQGLS